MLIFLVIRAGRAGTLEIPPLEAWEERLLWLEQPQRERIESPQFYRMLQEQIGRRYLAASTR